MPILLYKYKNIKANTIIATLNNIFIILKKLINNLCTNPI